ncbi:MAG: hypothetical protein KC431_29585, partial [Myxococcales bacterium]|nr:hypothetical protein [Myxococcales bacterium]
RVHGPSVGMGARPNHPSPSVTAGVSVVTRPRRGEVDIARVCPVVREANVESVENIGETK